MLKTTHSRARGISGNDTSPMVIDLLSWYYLVREKIWIIALGVALAAGGTFAYLSVTPKTYTATCVVQLDQESQKTVTKATASKVEESNSEDYRTVEALKTVEGALNSRSLMLRVVRKNRLEETPEFQVAPGAKKFTDTDYADIMERKVEIKLRRGTRLIDIAVDDTDPKQAAKLAESIVTEYVRLNAEQKSEATRISNEALFTQADEIRKRLEKGELALQEYREKYATMSLEEKQNLTIEKLKELNKQLQEARSQRIKLEAELPLLKKAATLPPDELLALDSVSKSRAIEEVTKMIAMKESEFGEIKERYLELHPKYQQVVGQLADLRSSIEGTARKVAAAQVNAIDQARSAEEQLIAALKEQESMGVELSRNTLPYNTLLRDTQADRLLYDAVAQRVKEIQLTQEGEKTNVRVIEAPDVPVDPSKPRKYRILAVALMIGGGLPMLGIFLSQAFNTTLRSVDEGEKTLDLPSLSAVPQAKGRAAKSTLVLVDEPAGREAEAFRCLRTSLSLLGNGAQSGQSVLITSAVPAEGKSYCAANYAVSLAQQGLRTLILDADLRRPGLRQYFSIDKNAPGVSEVLTFKATFDQACHESGIDKLTIMPAGTKGVNPAELLGSDRFQELLKDASGKFDRVVIDTAPVNAVSDTLLIVDKVDSVVLVVRARKTPSRILLRAMHLLELANARPVGFVLNRLPSRLANYYYYDEGSYSSAGVYGT
jgi:polysaccharide biosynthesis transport protein